MNMWAEETRTVLEIMMDHVDNNTQILLSRKQRSECGSWRQMDAPCDDIGRYSVPVPPPAPSHVQTMSSLPGTYITIHGLNPAFKVWMHREFQSLLSGVAASNIRSVIWCNTAHQLLPRHNSSPPTTLTSLVSICVVWIWRGADPHTSVSMFDVEWESHTLLPGDSVDITHGVLYRLHTLGPSLCVCSSEMESFTLLGDESTTQGNDGDVYVGHIPYIAPGVDPVAARIHHEPSTASSGNVPAPRPVNLRYPDKMFVAPKLKFPHRDRSWYLNRSRGIRILPFVPEWYVTDCICPSPIITHTARSGLEDSLLLRLIQPSPLGRCSESNPSYHSTPGPVT